MSTRSRISIINKDSSIESIYCHYDGYLENVGSILLDYYKDEEKIRKLLSFGDLSSLGEEIGEKHNFNVRPKTECTFYGRDRGEDNVSKMVFQGNPLEFLENYSEEYNYFYDINKQGWYVSSDGFNIKYLANEIDKLLNKTHNEEE